MAQSGINPSQTDNLITTGIGSRTDQATPLPTDDSLVAFVSDGTITEPYDSLAHDAGEPTLFYGFATLDAEGNVPVDELGNVASVALGIGFLNTDDIPDLAVSVVVDGSVAATLTHASNPILAFNTVQGQVGAVADALSSLVTLVAPSAYVCAVPAGPTLDALDTTSGVLNVTCVLTVANQLGTQAIKVTVTGTVAQVGTNQTYSQSWASPTVDAVVGTDLAWSSSTGVSSTAGGLFTVDLAWSLAWA